MNCMRGNNEIIVKELKEVAYGDLEVGLLSGEG